MFHLVQVFKDLQVSQNKKKSECKLDRIRLNHIEMDLNVNINYVGIVFHLD